MTTATRGSGLLENFLAQRRSARAIRLLRHSHARSPILDIGCGVAPTFLMSVPLEQRVGVERFTPTVSENSGIDLVLADAVEAQFLPFKSSSFGAITMLAVLEHLPELRLHHLVSEILRVLQPGGAFIWYNPDAPEQIKSDIRAAVNEVPSYTLATPYNNMKPGYNIALTAWGELQFCKQVSKQVLDDFRTKYQGRGASTEENLSPTFTAPQ